MNKVLRKRTGFALSGRHSNVALCSLLFALGSCQFSVQPSEATGKERVRLSFFEELKWRSVVVPSDLTSFGIVEVDEGKKSGFVRGDLYRGVGDGNHIVPETFVAFWDGTDCTFDLLGGLQLYLYWAKDASAFFRGSEKLISRGIVKPLLKFDHGEVASMGVIESGNQVLVVKDTGKYARKYMGYATYQMSARRIELVWTGGHLNSVSQLLPEMYSEKSEKSIRKKNDRRPMAEKHYHQSDLFVSLRYLGDFKERTKDDWERAILERLSHDWFRLPSVFSFDSCEWEEKSEKQESILRLFPEEQFENGIIDHVSVHWVGGAFSKLEYHLKKHPY